MPISGVGLAGTLGAGLGVKLGVGLAGLGGGLGVKVGTGLAGLAGTPDAGLAGLAVLGVGAGPNTG